MPVIDHELEREPVLHRQTSEYNVLGDNVFFPTNHALVRDLLGKLLTQLDVMNLPDRAHRAAKTLIVAEVWRWWDYVTDNCVTSYEGCLAPIMMRTRPYQKTDDGDPSPPSNRWGWYSEEEYKAEAQRTELEVPNPPSVRMTMNKK